MNSSSNDIKSSPQASRRSSLNALLKKTKSSKFETLFSSSSSDGPRRRSSLDRLKKAAGKRSTSLRSIFSNKDSASSSTGAADSNAIDDLDVALYKLYKGSISLPLHNRKNNLRRDSFELMARDNPDIFDGGLYRPRDWSLEEMAVAIGCAEEDGDKHVECSQ